MDFSDCCVNGYTMKSMSPEDIITLRRLCFPDEDFFFVTDYVFEKLSFGFTIGFYFGDEFVSMATLIPVSTFYGDRSLRTFFVTNVCTHPDHRHKGLASALLGKIKKLAAEKGADIIQLSSFSTDLFTKNGYVEAGHQLSFNFSKDKLNDCPSPVQYSVQEKSSSDIENNEIASIHACYMRNRGNGCFNRTVKDFIVKINEAERVRMVLKDGIVKGYCLVSPDCSYDFFFDDEDCFFLLISSGSPSENYVLCSSMISSVSPVLLGKGSSKHYNTQMIIPISENGTDFISHANGFFNPDNQ